MYVKKINTYLSTKVMNNRTADWRNVTEFCQKVIDYFTPCWKHLIWFQKYWHCFSETRSGHIYITDCSCLFLEVLYKEKSLSVDVSRKMRRMKILMRRKLERTMDTTVRCASNQSPHELFTCYTLCPDFFKKLHDALFFIKLAHKN